MLPHILPTPGLRMRETDRLRFRLLIARREEKEKEKKEKKKEKFLPSINICGRSVDQLLAYRIYIYIYMHAIIGALRSLTKPKPKPKIDGWRYARWSSDQHYLEFIFPRQPRDCSG